MDATDVMVHVVRMENVGAVVLKVAWDRLEGKALVEKGAVRVLLAVRAVQVKKARRVRREIVGLAATAESAAPKASAVGLALWVLEDTKVLGVPVVAWVNVVRADRAVRLASAAREDQEGKKAVMVVMGKMVSAERRAVMATMAARALAAREVVWVPVVAVVPAALEAAMAIAAMTDPAAKTAVAVREALRVRRVVMARMAAVVLGALVVVMDHACLRTARSMSVLSA